MVIENSKEFDKLARELGLCTLSKKSPETAEPCNYSVITVNRKGKVRVYQTTEFDVHMRILKLCGIGQLSYKVYRQPIMKGGTDYVQKFRGFTVNTDGKRLARYT